MGSLFCWWRVLLSYKGSQVGLERRRTLDPTPFEQLENIDNPLRCPVKLYEFYLSKWWVSVPNVVVVLRWLTTWGGHCIQIIFSELTFDCTVFLITSPEIGWADHWSSSSSSCTSFRATQVQKNYRAAVVSLSFRCGYGRWRALPNDLTNSSVFRARLKLWTDGRDVIAVGNEFQTCLVLSETLYLSSVDYNVIL